MRAYKAADVTQDGFIDKSEFKQLVKLLSFYDELFCLFLKLDTNNDKRISFVEFCKAHEMIGMKGSNAKELKRVFDMIDSNGGGMILFDEFCVYMAKQKVKSL